MPLRALVASALALATIALAPAAAATACGNDGGVAVGGSYVAGEGAGFRLWTESNGVAGLQRTSCTRSDGTTAPPDTAGPYTGYGYGYYGPCVYVVGVEYCPSY